MKKRDAAGGSTTTRRQVLAGALSIAGWTMTPWAWRASAQPAGCGNISGELIKLGEVRSEGNKLRAIMATRSKVWNIGDVGANQFAAERALRYFEAVDPSGKPIWPPADCPRPVPGPTLRARVGDRVEITFLNHIDVKDFELTGIDRGEKFPPGDNRGCDVLLSDQNRDVIYPGKTGDEAPNCFHGSSTTNIHFHGTHVTPDGLGDNVLLQLRPNLTVTEPSVRDDFQKIFDSGPPAKWTDLPEHWRKRQEMLLQEYDKTAGLPPENQLWPPTKKRIDAGLWPQYQIGAYPFCYDLTKYTENAQGKPDRYQMGQCPGTHWYHAHKHGSTAINVMNGMVGAFVIEGEYDDALAKIYPNLRDTEKVLVLHAVADTPNMARGNIPLGVFFGQPSLYVNGQLKPTITMRPGEIQLWRLVNATIKDVMTVTRFVAATAGAPLPDVRQTAQDGVQFKWDNFVEQPILNFRKSGKARPSSFAPGNRMDFLVKAPITPGVYPFILTDTAQFADQKDIIALNLRVEGTPLSMNFPTQENYPAFPHFLNDITAVDVQPSGTNPAKKRYLDFGWNDPKKNTPGPDFGSGVAPGFVINGKKFSGNEYDQEMVLGTVEEWRLENSTAKIAHPFHIHINPFQVVEIFDPNAENKLYQPSGNYVWQDVIAIPPATFNDDGTVKEKGRVVIRHRFVDFTGSFVLHCHMLAHEDRGMMELVGVFKKEDLGKTRLIPQHH
jgi:FtsP/CotA-like multicopper oxidase with cupredoxin domain